MARLMTALAAVVWCILMAAGAALASDPANISVKEAHARADKGELLLVDIRKPHEWRQSGIPANSIAITMHQSRGGFLKAIRAAAGKADRPIAFICAVGGRSRWLQVTLERAGIKNTINVLGGMFGTRRDIGWLKAGLPVKAWRGGRK